MTEQLQKERAKKVAWKNQVLKKSKKDEAEIQKLRQQREDLDNRLRRLGELQRRIGLYKNENINQEQILADLEAD